MAALLKPGSVGSAILTGDIIGEGDADFNIRVKRFRGRFRSPSIETTGDGDANPRFENSLLLYLDFVLQGWMLSSETIGIINLVDGSKNPSTAAMTITLDSTGKAFIFQLILDEVILDWDMTAPVAAIAMSGKMTNTVPDDAFERAVNPP